MGLTALSRGRYLALVAVVGENKVTSASPGIQYTIQRLKMNSARVPQQTTSGLNRARTTYSIITGNLGDHADSWLRMPEAHIEE